MSRSWVDTVQRLGYHAETEFDRLRLALKRRLGYHRPLQLVAYRGYGTPFRLRVLGRVLEGCPPAIDDDDRESLWENVLAAYRRFETDEIPGAVVEARFQNTLRRTVSDEEGYFRFELTPTGPLAPDRLWHPVALRLTATPDRQAPPLPVETRAEVLVPPAHCAFGVISDIDDTILQTGATSLLTMARMTFLHSARTRLPFAGVAAFYQALAGRTPAGQPARPIFYVSSSPWNLYDFLVDFMSLNDIPVGPLLLRDLGLDRDKFIESGHEAHKRDSIDGILAAYPRLPFILIGDSGQHDPEIYSRVAEDYPGRILAIYLRAIATTGERAADIAALGERLAARRVPVLHVADTLAAAEHAAASGFLDAGRLPAIRAGRAKDAGPPDPVERALRDAE